MNSKNNSGAVLFQPPPEFKHLQQLSIQVRKLNERLGQLEYKLSELIDKYNTLISVLPIQPTYTSTLNLSKIRKNINKKEE